MYTFLPIAEGGNAFFTVRLITADFSLKSEYLKSISDAGCNNFHSLISRQQNCKFQVNLTVKY